ncbi:MAG TPA: S-layer homology domain-containing protein [Candidatus Acutalibacter stercorigallinarum]|nr:S-layer homology domain-containing protein [Candidatus Acutalibacter stercorigallinarum]
MNKSKFLKKSLAMLLALMLVVAMIPLSASAAEGPAVTGVIVNGVAAKESGDASFTATITEPAVGEKVVAKVQVENDAGTVAHYTDATLLNSNNASVEGELWRFELTDKEMENKSFTFDVLVGNVKKQTYTVTYTTEAADGDATVKSVYLDGEYDDWNNIDTNNEIHYTVVAPYGLDLATGTHYVEVTPNSAKATVVDSDEEFETNKDGAYLVPVDDYDVRVPFTVVAENGKPANYTVTVVKPIPFASFSMEGERHESQISRVTEEPDFQVTTSTGEEATVELYPSYKYDGKFTPTFETNYGVKVVTKTGVELQSGETYEWKDLATPAPDRTKDYTILVDVKYSDDKTEEWALAFDVRTDGNTEKDTIPAIKGVTVNNYVAEIEGTTITLTLPKSVRENATDLKVKVSNATEVNVVDSDEVITATGDATDGFVTFNNIEKGFFETDKYTLRVTAAIEEFDADAKAVQDYTLNIVTAQVEQPKLNTMTLQNADGTVTLKADIDQSKGIVSFSDDDSAIPYSIKSVKDLHNKGWKLFWSVSQGATFTYNNSKSDPGKIMPLSGETVEKNASYLPDDANRFVGACEAADYVIVAVEGESAKAYKVVFTSAEASHESKLSDMKLTWNGVTKMEQLNTENYVKANVNNMTGEITASIFNKDWWKFNNIDLSDGTLGGNSEYTYNVSNNYGGATVITTLPEDAELYFVAVGGANNALRNDGALYRVDAMNETNDEIKYILPGVGWNKSYSYGDRYNHNDGDIVALKLIVISQALAEKVQGVGSEEAKGKIDSYNDLLKDRTADGLYTEYKLTLTQAAPRTGTDIDTLTVYDNYTGAKVTAAPVGNTITLNIPYYFVDENRKSYKNLFLDYTPEQGGQTALASSQGGDGTAELNNLVWKEDGTLDETQSVKLVWDNSDNHKAFMAYEPGKTGNNYGWIGHKDAEGKDQYPIQVEAEDGNTRKTPYSVVINILDANGEAELNSVTIAGSTATPNGKNVTVNVPFDTEVTSLAPEFNVSENAYVIEGGSDGIGNDTASLEKMVDEGETFNFLTSRTFTVVSEDGQNWNTYTITVVPSESFPDVTTDKWYYDEVMTAANKGWVTGDNGYFKPDDTMKRGDFALIVARILNYDPDLYTTAFPDVDADMYYSKAVAFCKYEGIIDGDDNGNFNAEDPITREEMAKIMCQALKLKVTVPEKTYADDAEIAEWAKGYVYACQEAGIMEGSGDNFNPRDNATRAEGAAVLVRAFA